jgi:hypothetical protein
MKACGGLNVYIQVFMTFAQVEVKCLVSGLGSFIRGKELLVSMG